MKVLQKEGSIEVTDFPVLFFKTILLNADNASDGVLQPDGSYIGMSGNYPRPHDTARSKINHFRERWMNFRTFGGPILIWIGIIP